jgi:predicted RNase H-like nuclease (RuvC/YqgF family)
MEEWLLMQGFYHGLTQKAREHLDATAGGSFLSLTIRKAKSLIEKISENQGWSQDHTQHCHQSEETVEEVNALSTKMDDLISWLDQRAKYKQDTSSAANKPLYQRNQKSNRQPTLRGLVEQQIRMNSEIKVKLATNDRILEDISVKLDSFSAAIEDQLKFNKKIEEKIKQLATVLPTATDPKQVRAITTRGGR